MSDICHCKVDVYMPYAHNASGSVVQKLIDGIKKAITVILEDELFKQRLNALNEECQRQGDSINIVSFFHSDMDRYNDLYRIILDVGRLENYIEKLELDGRMADVRKYPYDQAVRLADNLAHSLWELLNKSYKVLVQVNYSTEDGLYSVEYWLPNGSVFLKR